MELTNLVGLKLDTGGPWPEEQRELLKAIISKVKDEDFAHTTEYLADLLESVLNDEWN